MTKPELEQLYTTGWTTATAMPVPLSCARVVQTLRGPRVGHAKVAGFQLLWPRQRVDTCADALTTPGKSVASIDGLWSPSPAAAPSRGKPSARTGLTMVASTAN